MPFFFLSRVFLQWFRSENVHKCIHFTSTSYVHVKSCSATWTTVIFVCGVFEHECVFSPMTFALQLKQGWHLAQFIQNLHRPYLSCLLLCVIALYLGELFITLHVAPGVKKGERAAAHSPAHLWAETHRWWACARERRENKTDESNGGKWGVQYWKKWKQDVVAVIRAAMMPSGVFATSGCLYRLSFTCCSGQTAKLSSNKMDRWTGQRGKRKWWDGGVKWTGKSKMGGNELLKRMDIKAASGTEAKKNEVNCNLLTQSDTVFPLCSQSQLTFQKEKTHNTKVMWLWYRHRSERVSKKRNNPPWN